MSRDRLTELLAGAEPVKRNAVRSVFRRDGLYIKVDRRGGRRMKSEFNSAKLLASLGVPAVEPVEWGEDANGAGYLVTREFAGAKTALEAFYDSADHAATAEKYAKFLGRVIAAKVFHPDLHTGNVLYSNGVFRLVDLRGVRKYRWFDRLRMDLRRGSLLEFGDSFDDTGLMTLLKTAGSTRPADEFTMLLHTRAKRLLAEWPRRTRQILDAYMKFTRRAGDGTLLAADRLGRVAGLDGAVEADLPDNEAEAVFVGHFFLELAGIPHRAARGFDPASGRLWLEPEPVGAPLDASTDNDWSRRLAAFGRKTAPGQWRLVSGQPVLVDYTAG